MPKPGQTAISVQNKINSEMEKLVIHCSQVENDLMEYKGTVRAQAAEIERLQKKLEGFINHECF